MEEGSTVDLYILPEGCISNIISLTSPRDACRSSVISSVFRSATDSDSVWERFLPSDYQQILSSSVSPYLLLFSSKKELYLHLCNNPLLIDRGTKTLALEKCSGRKCYMIGAKELSIVWGDTPSYWNCIVVVDVFALPNEFVLIKKNAMSNEFVGMSTRTTGNRIIMYLSMIKVLRIDPLPAVGNPDVHLTAETTLRFTFMFWGICLNSLQLHKGSESCNQVYSCF
ncbi:F-box protein At2g02240-like [Macadamia integrifolia]|uniref:F-box protein At2g02240-like n=1 Tax=Macadamia integrifolia TaxID=60698 RepID=UPI001C4F4CF7|nr:F-box protein At2g02240-like [Macadamia integrifolia]